MEVVKDEVVVYQPDDKVRIEVRLNDDMIWISQPQMVQLFQSSKANISEHIKNIFQQNELDENSTVRKIRTLQKEGNREVYRNISYYNNMPKWLFILQIPCRKTYFSLRLSSKPFIYSSSNKFSAFL